MSTPRSSPNKEDARRIALLEMERDELREILNTVGIKKGLPNSRDGLAAYVHAAETNTRCNPLKGKWCENGYVCDASNKEGLCLKPDEVNPKLGEWEYNGRRIVGTEKALALLKKKLKHETASSTESVTPIVPSRKSKKSKKSKKHKARSPKTVEVIESEEDISINRPKSGTEIFPVEDHEAIIEQHIREIAEAEGDDIGIGELTAATRTIMKYVGLLPAP